MRKKILILPSWYPNESDAISGVFIQEQALALAKEYDVAVLVPGMAAWRNVGNPHAADKSTKEYQAGLPVYREFARPFIPHGPEPATYHTFQRAAHNGFKKLLKEWGRPDVIHAHVVLPGGWSALNVGRSYSIPIVLTEHSGPFSMHLRTKLQRRLVRETLLNVGRIVAVSPSLAQQILAFEQGVGISVAGELVRTDFFITSSNGAKVAKPATRFLFTGRLSEEKGVNHLLEAIYVLVQRGIGSFELVVAGDGPDRAKLEQITRSRGIADKCRFIGFLDRQQVRSWMQNSDFFILPSLHETFGIVLGEAMACGKPVIATRCGGPEFVVTDETGILVEVGSAEALADAMSDVISNSLRFDPAAVRASVVSRFGEEAFLRNISAVYEELW